MSDGTQGEGWWQASDGQWYPPEQHPGAQAPAAPQDPTAAMPAPFGPPPVGPPPTGAPMGPPIGPPAGPPMGPPPGGPAPVGNNNAKYIIGGVVAVAIIAIAAFLLLGGDDKKKVVATGSSSSSSAPPKSTTTTKPKATTTTTTKPSTSSGLNADQLQSRMLKGSDIAADFSNGTFTLDTDPTNCGDTNLNQQVPPLVDVGSTSSNGTASFQEEVKILKSPADAQKVVDILKAQTTCPNPTIPGGEPVTFTAPSDVSSKLTTPEELAFEVDFQLSEAQGQIFVIKDGPVVAIFTFGVPQGFDTSQLPVAIDVVNKGLEKILA